ncbi:hypothetical protein EVAR_65435_1 [Eumeta japonica]|uniref:Uncharacterized protein n=1 Tax=Eumeta variegata TaxID=151549 RepID=A0A4C1ZG04_EUMVA|nr:hypothetical protein EVAR_65435_1 [Eumeta japonica]
MRAWLCVAAAALALALPPPAARARAPAPSRGARYASTPQHDDVARQDHIKRQILAKLGLSQRPRPKGAPPRDVLQQIWARAADPEPPPQPPAPPPSDTTREIIAIAQKGHFDDRKGFFFNPSKSFPLI